MNQTNATFLVDDGLLMADKDQVISIVNARVIVEPKDAPSQYDAQKRNEEIFRRMDKAATRLVKWFVIGCAIYLLAEIIHAFSMGAIPGVGK